MNLNELSTEEIKGLLNVQKVLNALLDKISSVEIQITENREQIDTLTKTVNDLSNKILAMDISTNNELKQIKSDNITTGQKLFNIDKQLTASSKQFNEKLNEIEDYLSSLLDDQTEDEENKDETKKKSSSVNKKSVKELKKINKK